MKQLIERPADRLIVAADFKPTESQGAEWARAQVLHLAESLRGTGVYIKINSVLRRFGYELINDLHAHGLRVFADLKLIDIGNTLQYDGAFLRAAGPELLTVMCVTGKEALRKLKAELPETEVLGVTTLTSLTIEDTEQMFGCDVEDSVLRFTEVAVQAGIDGLISSPSEVPLLRGRTGGLLTFNTPGIRPEWSCVEGDDQNLSRVMTPAKAIAAGVDRLVIGRPITQAADPAEAVHKTLVEIEEALAAQV